jgi:pimeloyl-ACP methyl ester carboxylesterase
VLFAPGGGRSRQNPRNRRVAARLQAAGLGTLLFEFPTEQETAVRRNSGTIPLLAERLVDVSQWARAEQQLPIGWYGSGTGAAAVLMAAAEAPALVEAIVSRGGRPGLAGNALGLVRAPTLLIVGAKDLDVLERNREALTLLHCDKALQLVPGSGHLLDEGNTLDRVATLACHWFVRHLAGIGKHCWR